MKRDAKFSEDRKYRYVLDREWDESGSLVTFIMLNPSNADEVVDDRTIKRCITFAKEWGYGRLRVVNLFAYRSQDPKELEQVDDPVGHDNDDAIRAAVGEAELVVCAWGNRGALGNRGKEARELIQGQCEPHVLGLTKQGQPRHPLYVRGETAAVEWSSLDSSLRSE